MLSAAAHGECNVRRRVVTLRIMHIERIWESSIRTESEGHVAYERHREAMALELACAARVE